MMSLKLYDFQLYFLTFIGTPFCCDLCKSRYIVNRYSKKSLKNRRSKHVPAPQQKRDSATGKVLTLCNACGKQIILWTEYLGKKKYMCVSNIPSDLIILVSTIKFLLPFFNNHLFKIRSLSCVIQVTIEEKKICFLNLPYFIQKCLFFSLDFKKI